MTGFWKIWMYVWCASVAIFGVVIALGGFEATAGPMRVMLDSLNGEAAVEFNDTLHFSLAVMGAVSIGWSITLLGAIEAAIKLGPEGRSTWMMITASAVVWFVVDSALSVMTGFGLNVIPNTGLLAGYFVPVLATGVLKAGRGNPFQEDRSQDS